MENNLSTNRNEAELFTYSVWNALYTDLYALSKVLYLLYTRCVKIGFIIIGICIKEKDYYRKRGNVVPRVVGNPTFSGKKGANDLRLLTLILC